MAGPLHNPRFFNRCRARVDGEAVRMLPREVQVHPGLEDPLHVDFVRVGRHTRRRHRPVVFVNEDVSPGSKRGGAQHRPARDRVACPVERSR